MAKPEVVVCRHPRRFAGTKPCRACRLQSTWEELYVDPFGEERTRALRCVRCTRNLARLLHKTLAEP